jgi:hypothetical protein
MVHVPSESGTSREARRLRIVDAGEQREFKRLSGELLDGVMTEDQLRDELGYAAVEGLRHALESGRVTTDQFEKLRQIHALHLPGREPAPEPEPEPEPERRPRRAAARRTTKKQMKQRSPRKTFLDRQQHAQLREHFEHLWAVDRRFRNWALLAKATGLASGQAAKRAYEVNSSLATLHSMELFRRLFAGYGSRAADALQKGVPLEELQAHLSGIGAASEGGEADAAEPEPAGGPVRRRSREARSPDPAADQAAAARAAVLARSAIPAEPPPVGGADLVGIAAAIDAEVARLREMIRFFDGVGATGPLPRPIREAARQTRAALQQAAEHFAPSSLDGEAEAPRQDDAAED